MKQVNLKKQRGFALAEVVIALIIVAIAAIFASKNFGTANTETKVSQVIGQASKVHEIAQSKYGGVFTGCDMADLEEYAPDNIADGDGTNPYGGDIVCAANTDVYKLDVTFDGIPDEAGTRLLDKYGSDATFVAGSGSVTLTLGG